MLIKMFRDPLLHFTLAGIALFGAYSLFGSEAERPDENKIVVDENALLTFVQYRSKSFQPDQARAQLDAMDQPQRNELIRDYVREEALFRQAKSLGMIESDYIVRRRSVQKIEFIAQGMAEQATEIQDQEVKAFYKEHQDDYYEEPFYSFTHVFIKSDHESSESVAKTLMQKLNEKNVSFSEAAPFGDRFLYHRNYVERTPDFISSHFGAGFTKQLGELDKDTSGWQGPIASEHGLHLIKISEYRPGRVPPLANVRSQVERDLLRWKQVQNQELAIQQIVEQYRVEYRL